ncbi:hypothetical protein FRC02_012446 [Tulasnella sp. 418]|nr:hypothetical protein FRC02_012446 [Tulasnella sp. 418]
MSSAINLEIFINNNLESPLAPISPFSGSNRYGGWIIAGYNSSGPEIDTSPNNENKEPIHRRPSRLSTEEVLLRTNNLLNGLHTAQSLAWY